MKNLFTCLLALGSAASLSAAAQFAYPPTLAGARAETYKQVGGTNLALYLFEPTTPGTNRPAVVFFFGGGWQNGSPAQFEAHCRHFAERGMVAITADYRVGSRQGAKPTDCVADAKSCVRWLRQNAARLGIDPQRIVAAGGSAGGHLAAATATLPSLDEPGEDSRASAVPNALMLFNPALMLAALDGVELRGFGTGLDRSRLGAEPRELSPVHHVKPGTPPTLILHGKADTTVPYFTAEAFARAMKAAGNRCDLIGYEGQTHGFFNYGRGDGRYYRETLAAADAFLVSLGYLAPAQPAAAQPGKRPNIVFILTDDQGYGDLSCHGNPVLKTPNLDRLHAEGKRFTDFHVSPTCAPTRSALLTGRHEFKNGVTHTIQERERLTLKSTTLAQVLKSAGYTTGIFGKWHLGDEAERQPGRRGFDEVFIHGAGGIGQTYPGSCGDAPDNRYFDPAILHNGKFERTQGYCTDVFFNEALEWMGAQRGRGQPFFVFLTPNAPHAPLDVPDGYAQLYAGKVATNVAKFFGMIANIDDNVGRLLAKLSEWGVERDTLVVFMNDNGTATGEGVFNAGMRGKKGTPWLGGTRAASFWRWPGRFTPGDVPVMAAHIDVFPTFAEIAGAKLTPEVARQVEGRSLVPWLEGRETAWPERTLVTHFGRWERGQAAGSKYRQTSIRDARWQMVCVTPDGSKRWQLFDLTLDPGERSDVIASQPEVARRLEAAYDAWWDSILPCLDNEEAVGPAVNPFKALYWEQFGRALSEEKTK